MSSCKGCRYLRHGTLPVEPFGGDRGAISRQCRERRAPEEIWPFIEKASEQSPSHGHIQRDMVLFTTADRPMLRAGKGTLQRQATVHIYKADLDNLYPSSTTELPAEIKTIEETVGASDAVKIIISNATDTNLDEVAPYANLFDFGFDSLQVTNITKNINKYSASLGKPPSMSPRLVYAGPSLAAIANAAVALRKGNAAKGLGAVPSKVSCIEGDLSKDHFGMTAKDYKILLDSVSVVIDAAWLLNFTAPLESFIPCVISTRKLVDYSTHSLFGARVFLLSSSSSVAKYHTVYPDREKVPEDIVEDWRVAYDTPYGQSKFVSERILDAAAKVAAVPTAVCWVGQIAGLTNGCRYMAQA
ncbi:hypothetical protein N0V82_009876 [Gnomoniopsis sp. IMI 355080]|nr:hypothetical protein N0V82_009876 [Gnomoniopsis sp. IMI 355080]